VDEIALHQILIALTWLLLLLLLLMLWLLARFFERLSGKRTFHRWLLAPSALFTLAALENLTAPERLSAPLAAFLGGLCLSIFCLSLYRQMTLR
jgi:hypothetical protein